MRRAAQYLRMSTEHQQYSLANQSAAIATYAMEHDYLIVNTYTDAAKSGVTLRKRSGLKQLLEDVVRAAAGFEVILVYDISRWGRFQDADEAAHYEFICKSAGVPVEYCAEPFSNDSSTSSSLMKALKRSMAGEYSRELSMKVSKGQERLSRLGFRQGGVPGFGLRRLLLPNDPSRKSRMLEPGERKGLTDRVILVPGPAAEIKVVREIFSLFIQEKYNMQKIADHLNSRMIPFGPCREWDKHHVFRILTGHKYMGSNVYGRTKVYLSGPIVRVPREKWVFAPNSFTPIIDARTFELAQSRIAGYTLNKSDSQVLADLRELWKRKGRLSREIIERSSDVASVSTLEKRFGGLLKVYKLLGFDSRTRYYDSELLALLKSTRETFYERVCAELPEDFVLHKRGGNWANRLKLVSLDLNISVAIARHIRTVSGSTRWAISPNRHEQSMITVLLRLQKDNSSIHDLRVFETFFSAKTIVLRPNDRRLKQGVKVARLSDLASVISIAHRNRTAKE